MCAELFSSLKNCSVGNNVILNFVVSLKRGVRAINQTLKTAQITFVRTLDRTHWLPRDPILLFCKGIGS